MYIIIIIYKVLNRVLFTVTLQHWLLCLTSTDTCRLFMVCFRVCVSSGQADQKTTSSTTAMRTSMLVKLRLVSATITYFTCTAQLSAVKRLSCSVDFLSFCLLQIMIWGHCVYVSLSLKMYVPFPLRWCTKPMMTM